MGLVVKCDNQTREPSSAFLMSNLMAIYSVFSGPFSFQVKSNSDKKQENLRAYNTSWKCRARATPEDAILM